MAGRKILIGDLVLDVYQNRVVELFDENNNTVFKIDNNGFVTPKKTTTKRITNLDSPYTLQSTDDNLFCDTDGGVITVNLPAGINGTKYRIINCGSGANDVTVTPKGTELLEGVNGSKTLSGIVILTYETTEGWW